MNDSQKSDPLPNPEWVQEIIKEYIQKRNAGEQAAKKQRSSYWSLANQLEAQRRELVQATQQQENQKKTVPPSEQDPIRYKFYLQLCRFMEPTQALSFINQMDTYYDSRFQRLFSQAMQAYVPFFERVAEEAYVTDLGNLASSHIQNFYAAGSAFGITLQESQAIVSTFLKAYIDSGHRDLADIHNWFSTNSARILAAAIQEKKKIAEEEKQKTHPKGNIGFCTDLDSDKNKK